MSKHSSFARGVALLAAGALAFGVALPASAAADPKPGESTPPPAPVGKTAATKYCVVSQLTGSRLPHKTCKTRTEWLSEGFDPLAPEAK